MRALFAPDYRAGVAYQQLLADALSEENVQVDFLADYKRVMPLARALQKYDGEIFHLHWPEKYFHKFGDRADWFRRARYRLDLALGTRRLPLVVTAHDLRPHNRADESFLHANFEATLRRAAAVFVHSPAALDTLAATYHFDRAKACVIRHGDLSRTLGELPARAEARRVLSIGESERVCLLFGTVEPYKGIEPVIEWWKKNAPPATLAVVGKPITTVYKNSIAKLAGGAPNVLLDLSWQTDENLKRWLAAADAAVFNYRAIFTSGAAALARSLGLPILIPSRLATIDLMEPHPLVFRFESFDRDFPRQLSAALAAQPSREAAREWREATDWRGIARQTAAVYRRVARHLLD